MAKSASFAPLEHDPSREEHRSASDEEVAVSGVESDGEEVEQARGNNMASVCDDDDEIFEDDEEEEEAADESTLVINLSTPTMMKRDAGHTLLLSNEEHFYMPNHDHPSPKAQRKLSRKGSSSSSSSSGSRSGRLRKSPTAASAKQKQLQAQAQARAEAEILVQAQMAHKRVPRSAVKNSSNAVFYNNGSPTTIVPANMHFTFGAGVPGTPSAAFPSDFFAAASLGYELPGLSDDDLAPMDSTEMIRQFTNFSPEKTPGSKRNFKKLRKSRSASNLAVVEVNYSAQTHRSPARPQQQQQQAQDARPVTPTNLRPSPILPPSTIKEEKVLSVRKARASPADFDQPERMAKRIRSGSRSPVKPNLHSTLPSSEYISSSYPPVMESYNNNSNGVVEAEKEKEKEKQNEEEEKEASETLASLVRINSKTPRESRRRRETLEFRQFSKEFRDFSAITLNTLASLKQQQSDAEKEKQKVLLTPAKPIEAAPPSTSPPRRRLRPRRSMSGPPVPPHMEVPGTERKPAPDPVDIDGMHSDMNELVARISSLEAELAITKSQLSTSQNAHEATLLELRGEKTARKRAEGIIDFMKMESKFVLEAHVAAARKDVEDEYRRMYAPPPSAPSTITRPTRFNREQTAEHDDDDNRSVISTRSGRSIRSVNSCENAVRPSAAAAAAATSRRPAVTTRGAAAAPSRAGAAAPSRSRDPIARPNTTLGMYAAPTRGSARTQTTTTTTAGGRNVLTTNTNMNVLNQQPVESQRGVKGGKLDMAGVPKTRQQTTRVTGQSGPGGAMRQAMVGTGRTGAGARR